MPPHFDRCSSDGHIMHRRKALAVHAVDTHGNHAPICESVRLAWRARPRNAFPERFLERMEEFVRRRRPQSGQRRPGHTAPRPMDEAVDRPELRAAYGGPVRSRERAAPWIVDCDVVIAVEDYIVRTQGAPRCKRPPWLMAHTHCRPVAPRCGPYWLRTLPWCDRKSGEWQVSHHGAANLQGGGPVLATAEGLAQR